MEETPNTVTCSVTWASNSTEEGQQPLLPVLSELPVVARPPEWEGRDALELVREVLNMPYITRLQDLPSNIEVGSSGENDNGPGTYRIPLASNWINPDARNLNDHDWPSRRVHFERDEPESKIDWDSWREAANDWADGVAQAASVHVRDCYNSEELYDFDPDSMPDPEDYQSDDEEEIEYCCQVVGKEDDDDMVPHLDWALAMYMLIKSDEAEFLEKANVQ